MDRRRFVSLIFAASVMGSAAFAAGVADQIVVQLQNDGYTDIVIEKTWLGRIRITAVGSGGSREIIVNPSTGEILRDLWIASDGGNGSTPVIKNAVVKPAKSDDGNDDDDPDDDREDDDREDDDREDDDDDRDDDKNERSEKSGSSSGSDRSDDGDDD